MKFNYISSSNDGKTTSAVTDDFVAKMLVNRGITMISLSGDGTAFGFNMTDGASVRFQLKPNSAEVVYYAPRSK